MDAAGACTAALPQPARLQRHRCIVAACLPARPQKLLTITGCVNAAAPAPKASHAAAGAPGPNLTCYEGALLAGGAAVQRQPLCAPRTACCEP